MPHSKYIIIYYVTMPPVHTTYTQRKYTPPSFNYSNLTITTCHKTQDIGTKIEYDHDGRITKEQATPRTHGTSVTLQNLFSTLPVRHKEFQRNIKREYTKMMQVLQGYCVISTGVRLSCYTIGEKGKKSLVLATHANSDMRGNISNVFGPKQVAFVLFYVGYPSTNKKVVSL